MCRACYRGHRYCSLECRRAARTASKRRARAKYQATKRGKRNHQLAQNRLRQDQADKKNVTDQSSNSLEPRGKLPGDEPESTFLAGGATAASASMAVEGSGSPVAVALAPEGKRRCCRCGQEGIVGFVVQTGRSRQRGGWSRVPD